MNMQFSTSQKYINNQQIALRQYQQNKQPTPVISTSIKQIIKPQAQENGIKKLRWGEPTWFLFHTLAHKIKDEYFQQVRVQLLQTISSICSNLPCPICSEHAIQYIKTHPFFSIQTKQGLKDMLFAFHNELNKNKGFEQYKYEDLDKKYNSANTINIIRNFIFYFKDKSRSIKMIANDMHRERLSIQLQGWFNTNLQYFDN